MLMLQGAAGQGAAGSQSGREAAAVHWFRLASEQMFPAAINNLGRCYQHAFGVGRHSPRTSPRPHALARRHFVFCQRAVGGERPRPLSPLTPSQVDENPGKAAGYYRLAAEQGHVAAQSNLALCFYQGYGVELDHTQAVWWLELSSSQGHAEAINNLGLCYMKGTGVTKNDAKAAQLYLTAAAQGHATAMFNLAVCYQKGLGVPIDSDKALHWFENAAQSGHARAAEMVKVLAAKNKSV